MSELKCTGTIKQIGELITFDSGFQKVEFILTTNEKYPQDVKFDIVKEKAEQFLKYNKVLLQQLLLHPLPQFFFQ